nr:hypothetical protein pPsy0462c_00077 [Pseudomonas syringae]
MLSFPRPHSLVEGVVSAIRREIVSGRLPCRVEDADRA